MVGRVSPLRAVFQRVNARLAGDSEPYLSRKNAEETSRKDREGRNGKQKLGKVASQRGHAAVMDLLEPKSPFSSRPLRPLRESTPIPTAWFRLSPRVGTFNIEGPRSKVKPTPPYPLRGGGTKARFTSSREAVR